LNEKIRVELRAAGVKQWELADELGIAEMTLIRWLRYELSPDTSDRITAGIEAVKKAKLAAMAEKVRKESGNN